jgi:hypothetical protein
MPPFPEREFRMLARDRLVDVVLLRDSRAGAWEGVLRAAYGQPRVAGGMLAWRVRGTWPRSLGREPS